MRIVTISDTHGSHRALKNLSGDLLIHSGDFMYNGKDEREIIDFNEWLGQQDFKYRVVVAGNHDILFERFKPVVGLLTNAIYLEDSSVTIEGVKIWGSPYTPRFFDWAFNEDRGEPIKKHWDLIPEDTDILVTHGPPYGVLDTVSRFNPMSLGCVDLLEAVRRVKPTLHVFGHIHGGVGVHYYSNDNRTSVNASICNEQYNPVHSPAIFDWESLIDPMRYTDPLDQD